MLINVNIHNVNTYRGNPLYAQHRLRYEAVIDRQNWEVPHYKQLEYDQYDNPAATYLVWLDDYGKARGVSRFYPTDRPYMLNEVFSFLSSQPLPSAPDILEGSRFCIDHTLAPDLRKRIAHELIVGYLEYGLHYNIQRFIGVMLPIYWSRLFIQLGWPVEFLGEVHKLPNGQKIRAGEVYVSESVLETVRERTGISDSVLHFSGETLYMDKAHAA